MNILNRIARKLGLIKPIIVGTTNEDTRKKWIKDTLKKIDPGKKILDAGAGEQQYKGYCSHLNYLSQDIGEYDGNGETGLQTGKWEFGKLDIISDIINIPEPDDSFDAILCSEVIEHIPDPVKVFPEFSRLIKQGGDLIITAPFCSLTHFAPFHYATGFNRFFYEKHLSDNGFEIIELAFNGNYFEYFAQELHRLTFVSKKYARIDLKRKSTKAISTLLGDLQKLSKEGDTSRELLCFGIHIHARKR